MNTSFKNNQITQHFMNPYTKQTIKNIHCIACNNASHNNK